VTTRDHQPPLYVLAFDHRASFQRDLFGIEGSPDAAAQAQIAAAKQTIFAGYQLALDRGAPPASAGVLVDEEFGAEVARSATAAGHMLAMPVELSGQAEFMFEYPDWDRHIDAFEPDYVKALVRYNPGGDPELNARQAARLRELSTWLAQRPRYRFLFELLVVPTPQQVEESGSVEAFDHGRRPALVVETLAELQQAGVEPDVWKIEGLYRREACEEIATQARAGGRAHVYCIVLGRGADERQVEEWLRVGAGAHGFCGFAVGRTIWFDPLKAMLAGEISPAVAEERIATRYLREIEVYDAAAMEARTA
jgi:myo-inositol catabolism protein IolC